ncbi:DUF4395 domain-containing protein [Flaviflexus salsibiostraticola]|uniref:DUF4395 domain-containing protein n=1 Tax=Flaviflexus salsibiostraticola TaxID=1282737 RepID=A0A3Q8WSX1_9ACTO|nr:DUF4395 domain-containing protein [Flaviflexus salsibiostraticola]AZN29535.1 DUF4395 domain-containing protein [Flaviflexus salsibiostraticola]
MASSALPRIGTHVPGYLVPVIDERAVRAAAGILLLVGGIAFGAALSAGSSAPLTPFGMLFMVDMLARIGLGDRWSPSLALGRLAVRGQRPEWVGAPQKEFAWMLGFGLAFVSCSTMGLVAAPLWVTLALCATCLTLLFLESAFGICVGCALQRHVGRATPMYCPGGVCETDGPARSTTVLRKD